MFIARMAMALALGTNPCNSISSIDAKFSRPGFSAEKISGTRLRRRRFVVSNSVESASSEDIPENSMETKSDSKPSVAPPQSFSSLINPANIRKALAGVEVVAADHYGRLGIPRGASYAQVIDAFKSKCADLMQQGLDEETSQSKLQDLKESFEILSSEEERRFYDWSIARSENPERYTWPYEVDITQRSTAPDPPRELMLAGSESSATVVEWALAHLVNDPRELRAVQAEIDEIVGKDRLMEESDIPNLPYLNCVVKESLRLHPPGPLGVVHTTTADTELAGYFVPAHTNAIINLWAIGRDPQYWKRPGEFLPDRFVNCTADVTGNDFQLIPFGSGRRKCPGTNFAIPVNLLSLGLLVHAFEWNCEEKVDMSEKYGSLTRRSHSLVVSLRPRLSPHVYLNNFRV